MVSEGVAAAAAAEAAAAAVVAVAVVIVEERAGTGDTNPGREARPDRVARTPGSKSNAQQHGRRPSPRGPVQGPPELCMPPGPPDARGESDRLVDLRAFLLGSTGGNQLLDLTAQITTAQE